MGYDCPVEQAKRLLTFHKDMPWAQKELAELVPLLLEMIPDYDALEDKDIEIRHLEERIDDLEDEVSSLESDISDLEGQITKLECEIERLDNFIIELQETSYDD